MIANINLLPWREENRVRRQRSLVVALLVAGLIAGLLCWGWAQVAAERLAGQELRNRHLRQELDRLGEQARVIDDLRRRQQQLTARLGVIEALRNSRPVGVHLFDQLVRTLPAGLRYTRLECAGGRCTINGVAETHARISSLMDNLERSPWFQHPVLLSVAAVTDAAPGQVAPSTFILKVAQELPVSGGEVDEP